MPCSWNDTNYSAEKLIFCAYAIGLNCFVVMASSMPTRNSRVCWESHENSAHAGSLNSRNIEQLDATVRFCSAILCDYTRQTKSVVTRWWLQSRDKSLPRAPVNLSRRNKPLRLRFWISRSLPLLLSLLAVSLLACAAITRRLSQTRCAPLPLTHTQEPCNQKFR